MAVGDMESLSFATIGGSVVSFVPAGSNVFLIISFGSQNEGGLYTWNGAQSVNMVYKSTYTSINGFDPNNIKVPTDATTSTRVNGDFETGIGVIQVA